MRTRPIFKVSLALLLVPPAGGCRKVPVIRTVKAVPAHVEATVTTTTSGTVDAARQVVLGFDAAGRVGQVFVALGDRVEAGKVLAQLDNREAAAALAQAEQNLRRAKRLSPGGLLSRSASEDATTALTLAQARYEKTLIKAPFAGMVTELNLEVGEPFAQVIAGAEARVPLRLIDVGARLVKGQIDEVDLGRVRAGQRARVRIQAYRQEPVNATVSKVVPYVSTTRDQDRTAQIELLIDEEPPAGIPVGASADVEIIIDQVEADVAVPTTAVFGGSGRRFVYKVAGQELAVAAIRAGIANYDRTQVLEGLAAGDRIALPSGDVDLVEGVKAQFKDEAWP